MDLCFHMKSLGKDIRVVREVSGSFPRSLQPDHTAKANTCPLCFALTASSRQYLVLKHRQSELVGWQLSARSKQRDKAEPPRTLFQERVISGMSLQCAWPSAKMMVLKMPPRQPMIPSKSSKILDHLVDLHLPMPNNIYLNAQCRAHYRLTS